MYLDVSFQPRFSVDHLEILLDIPRPSRVEDGQYSIPNDSVDVAIQNYNCIGCPTLSNTTVDQEVRASPGSHGLLLDPPSSSMNVDQDCRALPGSPGLLCPGQAMLAEDTGIANPSVVYLEGEAGNEV